MDEIKRIKKRKRSDFDVRIYEDVDEIYVQRSR